MAMKKYCVIHVSIVTLFCFFLPQIASKICFLLLLFVILIVLLRPIVVCSTGVFTVFSQMRI